MCTIFQGEADDGKDKYDTVCTICSEPLLHPLCARPSYERLCVKIIIIFVMKNVPCVRSHFYIPYAHVQVLENTPLVLQ